MDESIASPTIVNALDEAIAYCRTEVRRFDPERYFASLFAGEAASGFLQALYAFNLEIAKTRETVSEPMLGQIRLQWWREAIDGIYAGNPRDHAVVRVLAHTIGSCGLNRDRFDRLIDGREFDLEDRQPQSLEDLVRYAEETSGELTCLALACLGLKGPGIESLGRSAGIGWALTGLLLAVPFHASQSRCYLPAALTDQHDVALSALYAGRPPAGLQDIVKAISLTASKELAAAREHWRSMPRNGLPALSHLSVAHAHLRRLENDGYDVFAYRPMSPFGRQWRIASANLKRRF